MTIESCLYLVFELSQISWSTIIYNKSYPAGLPLVVASGLMVLEYFSLVYKYSIIGGLFLNPLMLNKKKVLEILKSSYTKFKTLSKPTQIGIAIGALLIILLVVIKKSNGIMKCRISDLSFNNFPGEEVDVDTINCASASLLFISSIILIADLVSPKDDA